MSVIMITEIKHLTDRRNHITMTIGNNDTEKNYRRHTISGQSNTTKTNK